MRQFPSRPTLPSWLPYNLGLSAGHVGPFHPLLAAVEGPLPAGRPQLNPKKGFPVPGRLVMVATVPPSQAAANLNDLPPNSPPRPTMFHPNIISQPVPSKQIILDSRPQHRLPDDYRSNGVPAFSNGDGALPVPGGPPPQHTQATNGGLRHRAAPGGGVFDGPRSPPSTKSKTPGMDSSDRETQTDFGRPDTSHVPCKFFRSGQCQAGKACPFSHSTDISTADTPCKYFAKVQMIRQAWRSIAS